ncbi:hypothetical protein SVAN01_05584 [Stagonosporopsis vannaccii]|nr:hypothetical protein SVAN01_05584 [Stagonosporopsis vannaccii]
MCPATVCACAFSHPRPGLRCRNASSVSNAVNCCPPHAGALQLHQTLPLYALSTLYACNSPILPAICPPFARHLPFVLPTAQRGLGTIWQQSSGGSISQAKIGLPQHLRLQSLNTLNATSAVVLTMPSHRVTACLEGFATRFCLTENDVYLSCSSSRSQGLASDVGGL